MTRMWMTPPETMCRQHLLGEHKELHQLLGHLRLGRKLGKYTQTRLVEPLSLYARHEQLVAEMKRRGYNHKSPIDEAEALTVLSHLPEHEILTTVDRRAAQAALIRRCDKCKQDGPRA